jgi:hypothetical protein
MVGPRRTEKYADNTSWTDLWRYKRKVPRPTLFVASKKVTNWLPREIKARFFIPTEKNSWQRNKADTLSKKNITT